MPDVSCARPLKEQWQGGRCTLANVPHTQMAHANVTNVPLQCNNAALPRANRRQETGWTMHLGLQRIAENCKNIWIAAKSVYWRLLANVKRGCPTLWHRKMHFLPINQKIAAA